MYKKTQDSYVYKVAEMEIKYNTKVKASERTKVRYSSELADVFRGIYPDGTIEYCELSFAALLNKQNQVLGIIRLGEGSADGTSLNLHKALQAALLCNARGIAICHNHPSGNLQPSRMDDDITNKARQMCNVMGYQFIDHIILSDESFYSYRDNGKL